MVDLKQSPRRFGRKSSLIAAGLLAASTSLVLLPKSSVPAANATAANPVVAKVLSDARKHRSKGRYAKAAALLKDHATPGNPLVLLNYGKLLARGWGVPKNLDEAREKLLMAVQHDFPKRGEAAFELGRVYRQSQGPDCDRIAFEWFVESAKAGHVKAHAELGRHYARGIGVPVDIHNALKHYRIAARSGAANSLVSFVQSLSRSNAPELAEFDLEGLIQEAIPALEGEAAGGRGSSAKVLGRLYRDGVHVSSDRAMARMWFERGARLGDSGSMVELALMIHQATSSSKDLKRALSLLEHAAELRNSGALTELGRLHLAGGNGLDKTKAKSFFERGSKAGHAGSMLELARLHLQGDASQSDQQRAIKLLKRGAAKGHAGCKKLLAKLLKLKLPASAADLTDLVKRAPIRLVSQSLPGVQDLTRSLRIPLPVVAKVKPSIGSGSIKLKLPQSPQSPMTGATVNTRFGKKS